MDIVVYLWTCIIIFLASFIKGLSGFAALLIAIPLLSLFLDIRLVVPLATMMSFSVSLVLFISLRKQFDFTKLLPLIVGVVPGVPIGVYLLKRLDRQTVLIALGVVLVAYSGLRLLWKSGTRGIPRKWGYVFGVLAGCFGGGLSAHGAIIIVYSSLQDWTRDEVKAFMQGFFLISAAIIIVSHAIAGLTDINVLRLFAVSVPAMLTGSYLGARFYSILKEDQYTSLILCLLALLGVVMIYKNL